MIPKNSQHKRSFTLRKGKIGFLGIRILFLIPLILTVINARVISQVGPTDREITETDEIFTTYINDLPSINIDTWRLNVSGLVDTPVILNYTQLLSMPSHTINATLFCVDGYKSYALWQGVLLDSILNQTGIKDSATDIIFHGLDGYNSSFNLDSTNLSEVLLATHVNNESLPADLGFPLRIVAPGHYGYKWVMFLSEIIVVDFDHLGYWESRGWKDEAQFPAERDTKIWTDWAFHAIGLSLAFFLGGIAWMGGMKKYLSRWSWLEFPKRYTREYHLQIGILYSLILIGVAGWWIIRAILLKGNLDWTIHGIGAVTSATFSLGIFPTYLIQKRKPLKSLKIRWHLWFSSISMIALTMTIITGLRFVI